MYTDWLIDAAEILSPTRDHNNEYAGQMRDMYLGKRVARLKVNTPIFDVHQSYGSNSHEAILARMMACVKLGRPFFTGEGFVHPDMMAAASHCILQFGSGGFGPWVELDKFAGVSMKYGQDAKKKGRAEGYRIRRTITRLHSCVAWRLSDIFQVRTLSTFNTPSKNSLCVLSPLGLSLGMIN